MQTFIKGESEYAEVVRSVGSVFDTAARLPDRVFRRTPIRSAFFEFDDVFEEFFWQAVQAVAGDCHDPNINLLVIDPHPETYFRRHFGFYGAAELPVSTGAADYRQLLSSAPADSPADSLVDNGRILAFAGSGETFGFWCERELEIGVVGLFRCGPERSVPALPSAMRWKSTEEALALMAPTYLDRKAPSDLSAALRANYST